MTRISRRTGLFIATGALVVGSLSVAAASAADNPQNPQASSGRSSAAAAAAAPASCIKLAQPAGSGGQHYRNLANSPVTFTPAVNGTGFFNIPCGKTTFKVARGQQALVTLRATAEHDCNAPTATANGWCEARFLVNGVVAKPDNTGRGDTYALDSTNGGSFNWSAHSLAEALVVNCPRSTTTTAPCTETVQLQGRFQNGANSWWYDDATVETDVTIGAVATSTLAPTAP